MDKTNIQNDDFNLAAGEPKESDMEHTKVDPYQDPAYNAPPQSPAHASGHPQPVGQEDSLVQQCPQDVGQKETMVPRFR